MHKSTFSSFNPCVTYFLFLSFFKTTLKNIGCVDVLTLEQILGLTEKTVLNMFTEVSSNELARTFTYICQLMPKDCNKEFSSFGNEMRARADMKKHIYEHLNNLEQEGIVLLTLLTKVLLFPLSVCASIAH